MSPGLFENLPKDEKLFFSAFQYAAIGMALVAPNGKWLLVNKALCNITGYDEQELLDLTFQEITHPDDLEDDLDSIQKILSGDLETYQKEKRYFHKDGSIIHVLLSVSLVKDNYREPLFFISQIQNITDRKQLEGELVRQATEDMLTGICNRRRFYDLAEREILRGGRYSDPVVLLMLDMDLFKKINDTYGHGIGDEVLKKMVNVCNSKLRVVDIFGRIGGEEFGILLVKTDAVIGRKIAERLRRSVEQCILTTEKGVVKFTVSIGGVAFSGNKHSLEDRLKQADGALYEAKSKGRNKTVLINNLPLSDKESERLSFIYLKWNYTYECGNKKIDRQHRNLFKNANLLLSALISRQERSVCRKYIDELISETSKHFKTEEHLIKDAGYPGFDEHKKIHDELIDKSLKMSKRHEEGLLGIAEVFQFIAIDMVSRHMLEEDQKFFYCFQDK